VTRHRTDDLRITGLNPLISPAVLAYYLPLTEQASELVASARAQADAILRGDDDRLLAVVGPCSIHDPEAALEYGAKLKEEADRLKDDVFVIMRVYFEKPRTTVGWKGLINDPNLDDSFDINHGLRVARGLLLDLANMGLPAGTEFLDTISPQYIPNPPGVGVRPFNARRIQERHGRFDPNRLGRNPVGLKSAPFPVGDETRGVGDFFHGGQRIVPSDPAWREDRSEL
jgi:phospho-2-dehydro-3-deoxyheptonate aldolase